MAIYDLTKTPADSYDTHTHLNDDKLFHDVPAYIGRANEFRVMEMNIVGYDAVGNARALEIAQAHDNIYAVLGFQPEDTGKQHPMMSKSKHLKHTLLWQKSMIYPLLSTTVMRLMTCMPC